jgi:hypothetical protein
MGSAIWFQERRTELIIGLGGNAVLASKSISQDRRKALRRSRKCMTPSKLNAKPSIASYGSMTRECSWPAALLIDAIYKFPRLVVRLFSQVRAYKSERTCSCLDCYLFNIQAIEIFFRLRHHGNKEAPTWKKPPLKDRINAKVNI